MLGTHRALSGFDPTRLQMCRARDLNGGRWFAKLVGGLAPMLVVNKIVVRSSKAGGASRCQGDPDEWISVGLLGGQAALKVDIHSRRVWSKPERPLPCVRPPPAEVHSQEWFAGR